MNRSTLAACAAALVAAAALPAAASAAEITYDGDTIVFKAAPGEENSLTLSVDEPGKLAVGDSGATPLTFPADRCTQISPEYAAQCDMPSAFKAELDDRDDSFFSAYQVPASLAVSVLGEDGNDELKGGETHKSTLDGGAGNDVLESQDANDTLIGGAGNDELLGSGGSDQLMAGDGDDYLRPDTNSANPGDDLVDGGAGIDRVEDWVDNASSGSQRPVTISLDGQANDGRGSERDNVQNIEEIRTFVGGKYVLSDGAERVELYAPSDRADSTIEARGGDDTILAGLGAQSIDGGAGNDKIEGGFGDDTIVGGPGRDVIAADFTGSQCGVLQSCTIPHGNDTIDARDGEADTIDCGVGEDKAIVDAQDTVSDCEQVETAQAPGGPGADNGQHGSPNGPSGARVTLARKVRLRAALRSGLKVKVAAAPGADVAVAAKQGSRTVGRGKGRAGTAGVATVTIKFTKAAKRALARKKRVKLTLIAAGASASVTLRR